ncbi:MAG TPA: DciA family protein [Stellaceae bacterium]|nr:DciA family protein [Stellaceae bacterium]
MSRAPRDHNPATLSVAAAERERRPGLRAIGLAASRLAAPIVGRSGGGVLARLKAEWPAIVGAELAAATWPDRLSREGVLKLRIAGTLGPDLQHRAPLLIERINLYFGRAAISRLVLVQGPLPLPLPPARTAPAPLAEAQAQALDRQLDAVADPELRAALARLGRLVAASARRED